MKIDPYIKEFLQDENIKNLINENKIEEVFNIFYYLIFFEDNNKIDSPGELAKQFYDLINKFNFNYKEGHISKAFGFISRMMGKRVRWLAEGKNNKQGTIANIFVPNYGANNDDSHFFNNSSFLIDFDDGTFKSISGTMLDLIH